VVNLEPEFRATLDALEARLLPILGEATFVENLTILGMANLEELQDLATLVNFTQNRTDILTVVRRTIEDEAGHTQEAFALVPMSTNRLNSNINIEPDPNANAPVTRPTAITVALERLRSLRTALEIQAAQDAAESQNDTVDNAKLIALNAAVMHTNTIVGNTVANAVVQAEINNQPLANAAALVEIAENRSFLTRLVNQIHAVYTRIRSFLFFGGIGVGVAVFIGTGMYMYNNTNFLRTIIGQGVNTFFMRTNTPTLPMTPTVPSITNRDTFILYNSVIVPSNTAIQTELTERVGTALRNQNINTIPNTLPPNLHGNGLPHTVPVGLDELIRQFQQRSARAPFATGTAVGITAVIITRLLLKALKNFSKSK
jgi:hypothetical protein